jgi:hypothetical protein
VGVVPSSKKPNTSTMTSVLPKALKIVIAAPLLDVGRA